MFAKLLQWVFMDKRGRDAARKLRRPTGGETGLPEPAAKQPVPPETPPVAPEDAEAESPAPSEREQLIAQTMALYREKHKEYEQLDENVRERLSKIASGKLDEKD